MAELAEQENKRRAAAQPPELAAVKKRVVLGDLTNSPPELALTSNCKTKSKCNYSSSSSIYKHLHALEMEVNRRPLPNYTETVQRDVSSNMREILVDWLVEVADDYKLASDTLYLAVSCVDRFLSTRHINRNKLQLLGVSSMLIASKYEEINPPHAEDLCYITDNTYTLPEVLDMERQVVTSLNFNLGNPTPKTFLRIFIKAAQNNFQHSKQQLEFLASYLLELCLLDYKCLKFLPSVAAASALFLSRFTIEPNNHPWNLALQCQTGYKPCDLKECVLAIHAVQWIIKESPLQGVRQKYLQHKFTCVASLTAGEIPASYFEPIDE